jgi:hypothetical protein
MREGEVSYQELRPGRLLPPRALRAVNNAVGVGIHDDATAIRYGFRGGLVPGITLFTYLAHALYRALGEGWLQRGQMELRFRRPVYHGDAVTAQARVGRCGEEEVEMELWLEGAEGLPHAQGTARLPLKAPPDPPADLPYIVRPEEAPPLPPLRPGQVPLGLPFRPLPVLLTAQQSLAYAREVGLEEPVYGRLANPGLLLRQTVRHYRPQEGAGGWEATPAIHMGYQVAHYGPVVVDRPYTLYGQYVDAFRSSKGDEFAVSEHALLDEAGQVRFLARITTIYYLQPRPPQG